MIEENSIERQIKCHCGCGVALLEGLEIRLDSLDGEKCSSALVTLLLWRKPGYNPPPRLWQRIKDAWTIICSGTIYTTDITLHKDGILKLREACDEFLTVWPSPEDLEQERKERRTLWKKIKENWNNDNLDT